MGQVKRVRSKTACGCDVVTSSVGILVVWPVFDMSEEMADNHNVTFSPYLYTRTGGEKREEEEEEEDKEEEEEEEDEEEEEEEVFANNILNVLVSLCMIGTSLSSCSSLFSSSFFVTSGTMATLPLSDVFLFRLGLFFFLGRIK